MATIPAHAEVSADKLRGYLLVPRESGDKSGYLSRGGFFPDNWRVLEAAIRRLASAAEAIQDGRNEYGRFWRVEGLLVGPRRSLPVVLIWIEWATDGSFHFVTLKPLRGLDL